MDEQTGQMLKRDLDRLAQELAQLRARVDAAVRPTAAGSAPFPQRPEAPLAHSAAPSPRPLATTPLVISPSRESSAGNLLGLIGGICFVLAGVFIVRLAIQAGWLTPERQFGLAVLLGISLVFVGFRARKLDPSYSGLLPGCGIAVLAAAAVGGHRYFELYDSAGAIGAMAGVSLLSIALYRSFQHEFFVLTAVIANDLLPFVLKSRGAPLFHIGIYYVVWTATFSVISIWIESRVLPLVAGYLGIGCFAVIALAVAPGEPLVLAGIQAVQAILILLGIFRYATRNRSTLAETEAWAFFPLALFFYGMEYLAISRAAPEAAPWLGLGFAASLIAAALVVRNRFGERALPSRQVLHSWAAVVAFHSGYLQLLPDSAKPFLLLAFLFGMPLARLTSRRTGTELIHRNVVPAFLLLLVLMIEYCRVIWRMVSVSGDPQPMMGMAVAAGLLCFFLTHPRGGLRGGKTQEIGYALLVAAHLQAVEALYRWTESVGSLAVSGAWSFYSAAVLWLAFFLRDPTLGRSSLVVLLIAAGKALVYDASEASPGIRVLCLFVTGVALYGAGLLFRGIARWDGKNP